MKNLLACAALLSAIAGFTAPAPVEATNFAWTVGGGFHVGGAQFHITMRDGHYGGPAYFYRTPRHIQSRGYACAGACYRDRGQYYHDPYCPVAEAYFHNHGFTSYDLFVRYAPRWPRQYRQGYRWGPYFAPGHYPGVSAYLGYGSPPGQYLYYQGYGSPDRSGARYERWDRRPNKSKKKNHGHSHHDD